MNSRSCIPIQVKGFSTGRDNYVDPIPFLNRLLKGRGLQNFTMYQEDALQAGYDGLHPLEKLRLVGVPAELVELGYFGPQAERLAENRDFRLLIDDFPA